MRDLVRGQCVFGGVGSSFGPWCNRRAAGEKIIRLLTLLAGFVAALLLQACGTDRSPEVRYRVTIEVETPQGVRTGSSVWSFELQAGGLASSYDSRFRGEAIAVDLPAGRTLFGLPATRNQRGEVLSGTMGLLPEAVYRRIGLTSALEREFPGDRAKTLAYIEQLPRRRIALDCARQAPPECPLLVLFRNPSDPSTVEAIPTDQLGLVFGEGVRLRSITLEITEDHPEFRLAERLPWLNGASETSLKPEHSGTDFSLPATLHYRDFLRR